MIDHKRIDSLAEAFQNSQDPEAQQEHFDLLLKGLERYLYARWSKGRMDRPREEFQEACHWVLEEALRTYGPEKGKRFASWCWLWMRAFCSREKGQRAKQRAEETSEVLRQRIAQQRFRDPLAEAERQEQMQIVQEALERESPVSRMVVVAWSQGHPRTDELADIIETTAANIRQKRLRNLRSMRSFVRARMRRSR
ncbi:MAG: hypothetical protein ACOC7Q_02335 [bacterium]